MNRSSLYLCAASLASLAFVSAASGGAALLAGWSIPDAFPTNPPPGGQTYSVGAADLGILAVGTDLFGVHANEETAWTSPVGNGSPRSFSSNRWTIGDYYQANLNTTGYESIVLSWDQARSSTGPQFFSLQISVDGGTSWIEVLESYEVLQSGGGGSPGTWSSTTYNPIYTTVVSLGATAADQADLRIRFEAISAAGGDSGSNRIDDVLIFGTLIPAPGAIALLALAGLAGSRRRR